MRARFLNLVGVALLWTTVGSPQSALAQPATRVDVGGHVAWSQIDLLDANDVGVGARVAWRPGWGVGVEGELTLFPAEFPDGVAISRRRLESLFGITVGPTLGAVRPFLRVRSGWLRYSEAPGPIACIAIFPPPINCQLAGGHTLPAFDVGGGLEWSLTERTFVRGDIGDRLVRYPGPSFVNRRVYTSDFWRHELRLAVGAGLRF